MRSGSRKMINSFSSTADQLSEGVVMDMANDSDDSASAGSAVAPCPPSRRVDEANHAEPDINGDSNPDVFARGDKEEDLQKRDGHTVFLNDGTHSGTFEFAINEHEAEHFFANGRDAKWTATWPTGQRATTGVMVRRFTELDGLESGPRRHRTDTMQEHGGRMDDPSIPDLVSDTDRPLAEQPRHSPHLISVPVLYNDMRLYPGSQDSCQHAAFPPAPMVTTEQDASANGGQDDEEGLPGTTGYHAAAYDYPPQAGICGHAILSEQMAYADSGATSTSPGSVGGNYPGSDGVRTTPTSPLNAAGGLLSSSELPSAAAAVGLTPRPAKAKREACTCPMCKNGTGNIIKDGVRKKLHQCHYPDCLKVYGKTSHLRAHLRGHNGERPFVCLYENCDKRFTRSDELQRHNRTHTGEKKFVCETCGKRFMRSDHLSKHLRVHTSPSERGRPGPQRSRGRGNARAAASSAPAASRRQPAAASIGYSQAEATCGPPDLTLNSPNYVDFSPAFPAVNDCYRSQPASQMELPEGGARSYEPPYEPMSSYAASSSSAVPYADTFPYASEYGSAGGVPNAHTDAEQAIGPGDEYHPRYIVHPDQPHNVPSFPNGTGDYQGNMADPAPYVVYSNNTGDLSQTADDQYLDSSFGSNSSHQFPIAPSAAIPCMNSGMEPPLDNGVPASGNSQPPSIDVRPGQLVDTFEYSSSVLHHSSAPTHMPSSIVDASPPALMPGRHLESSLAFPSSAPPALMPKSEVAPRDQPDTHLP